MLCTRAAPLSRPGAQLKVAVAGVQLANVVVVACNTHQVGQDVPLALEKLLSTILTVIADSGSSGRLDTQLSRIAAGLKLAPPPSPSLCDDATPCPNAGCLTGPGTRTRYACVCPRERVRPVASAPATMLHFNLQA